MSKITIQPPNPIPPPFSQNPPIPFPFPKKPPIYSKHPLQFLSPFQKTPQFIQNTPSNSSPFSENPSNISPQFIQTPPPIFPLLQMDTFFVSHGSPTLSIDESLEARHFLQSWRASVMPDVTPKAILVVSGHWDTKSPEVNVIEGVNETIYDFYGFPREMYQLKYPAPGAPQLAKRVASLLKSSGFGPVKEDKSRGLDHGAWVPLMLMYPDASVPVCQLSVQSRRDAGYHYEMGRALRALREDGVLVLGSGSATHNLRALAFDGRKPPAWAEEFDGWLKDAVLSRRYDEVNHFMEKVPSAKMAHPWPDHFYPLHVAIGAAGGNPKSELIHTSWSAGSLSYTSFRFTSE